MRASVIFPRDLTCFDALVVWCLDRPIRTIIFCLNLYLLLLVSTCCVTLEIHSQSKTLIALLNYVGRVCAECITLLRYRLTVSRA